MLSSASEQQFRDARVDGESALDSSNLTMRNPSVYLDVVWGKERLQQYVLRAFGTNFDFVLHQPHKFQKRWILSILQLQLQCMKEVSEERANHAFA